MSYNSYRLLSKWNASKSFTDTDCTKKYLESRGITKVSQFGRLAIFDILNIVD